MMPKSRSPPVKGAPFCSSRPGARTRVRRVDEGLSRGSTGCAIYPDRYNADTTAKTRLHSHGKQHRASRVRPTSPTSGQRVRRPEDLGTIAGQGVAAKTPLAAKINELILARGLSQAQAGHILRMPQPKVSAIRNYKLRGISLERLLEALADLGQVVEIVIRQAAPGVPAGIRVPA